MRDYQDMQAEINRLEEQIKELERDSIEEHKSISRLVDQLYQVINFLELCGFKIVNYHKYTVLKGHGSEYTCHDKSYKPIRLSFSGYGITDAKDNNG